MELLSLCSKVSGEEKRLLIVWSEVALSLWEELDFHLNEKGKQRMEQKSCKTCATKLIQLQLTCITQLQCLDQF